MEKKQPPCAQTPRSNNNTSSQSTSNNSKTQTSESSRKGLDSSAAKSWPKKNRRRGETQNTGTASSVEQSVGRHSQKNNNNFKPIQNTAVNNQNHNQQYQFNRGLHGCSDGAAGGGGRSHQHQPNQRHNEQGPTSAFLSPTSGAGLDHHASGFEAELDSVYSTGNKKQNMNHLLNFKCAPRNSNHGQSFDNSPPWRTGMVRRPYSKLYNKETFLQANCQFVVRADMDWRPYTQSPDKLVDWQFIEQILSKSAEEPQCPICLYYPVAGKMTRCGHVFCWPCVLHYLALSDKSFRKCPICYEHIHVGDLKSTISQSHATFKVDDYVELQLMCRPRDSLHVVKVTESMVAKERNYPHLFDDENKKMYSKLILADPNEISSIIERERNELKSQLFADGPDCPESMFIQQALELLEERQNECAQYGKKFMAKCLFHPKPAKDVVEETTNLFEMALSVSAKEFMPNALNTGNAAGMESIENSGRHDDYVQELQKESLPEFDNCVDVIPSMPLANVQVTPKTGIQNIYFYQSVDGQNVYLHSLNMRMLQEQWGSLEAAPRKIRGKIIQKDSCSLTVALRDRLKHLQHLPVATQFEIVEIRLDQSLVSDLVFKKFEAEIHNRQQSRKKRAKQEQKREKLIDEVNDRQIGKIPERSANIDFASIHEFPVYEASSYDAVNNIEDNPPLVELSGTSSTQTKGRVHKSSFSGMLTEPPIRNDWHKPGPSNFTNDFPELSAGSSKSTAWPFGDKLSPPDQRYKLLALSSSENAEDSVAELSDEEAATRPPEFRPDYGTAIANALNAEANRKLLVGDCSGGGGGSGNGRKLKKKKKHILFTTNTASYNGF